MAWGKVRVEDQKKLFIEAFLKNKYSKAQLCRQFDISRPTGYETIRIYNEKGWDGLKEQSKKPHYSPNQTKEEIRDRIIAEKLAWIHLGPDKILAMLKRSDPLVDWPSSTTIGKILDDCGLVQRRKLRKRIAARSAPLAECNDSNDTWCIDFKGWWTTCDGIRYEPLTLLDAHSRYLLCCQLLKQNTNKHVWGVFERLFGEFGLPSKIRSDNGAPFATGGAGRLSRLSISLIKAGVIPEWIEPGNPQQNGRQERMHSTLKKEGVDVCLDVFNQTKKLEEFAEYYNYIRPHAAIGQKCPGEIYQLSPRSWDGRLRSPEYTSDFKVGNVHTCGKLMYKSTSIYVGRVFEGEPIGLRAEEGVVKAYYGPIYLGVIHDNKVTFERRQGRKRR